MLRELTKGRDILLLTSCNFQVLLSRRRNPVKLNYESNTVENFVVKSKTVGIKHKSDRSALKAEKYMKHPKRAL